MEDSIGGMILVKMMQTLHSYFIETFNAIAESFYALAALLVTGYIVYMGWQLIKGRVGESLQSFLLSILIVPLCFAVFFHAEVFEEWIYQPIISTMLGMMGLALGGEQFTLAAVFTPIDESFVKIFEAVDRITNQMDTWDVGMKVKVFAVSAMLGLTYGALYVIFTVLIIAAVFAIHVLIILGPIFGTLAAFEPTRGYFKTWLKGIITYAFVPVFTAIVMGITLTFLDMAIIDIANVDVAEEGVFTYAIGSALFIGIMSITLHLKAPEFASMITGAQVSGLGGFFGTVGAIGFGGAAAAGAAGRTQTAGKLREGIGKGASGLYENTLAAGRNAYSKMRGFGK